MSLNSCPTQPAVRSRTVAVSAALFLASGLSVSAQIGYQVQGNYNPATAMPSAYQQMGGGVPSAGAGLQQPLLPAYGYGYNPAYQQLPPPAAKPAKAQSSYKPQVPAYRPGQSAGPMPYPASHELPGAKPPAPPQPKAADARYASLANDVAALRYNDRVQDRRLENLERGRGTTVQPAAQTTQLTYVKHQVRARESIWGIADRYGVTADDIRRANNRRSDFIAEGEVLYVPQRVPVRTEPVVATNGKKQSVQKATGTTHTVQRGESLSAIAATYRVSTKTLQSANGIRNPNLITLGQKLVIPGAAATAKVTPAPSTKKPSKPTPQHYVTKSPAKPSATVVKAPEPPPAGVGTSTGSVIRPSGQRGITSYRVEGGDSIESVARSFGTTPSEIQRINRLSSPKLPATGEEIVVPLPGSIAL